MTQYSKGTRIEYILRDWFASMGAVVLRSAGSHGAIDLVVITEEGVMLVQCKKTSKSALSEFKKDVEKLLRVPASGNVTRWLAVVRMQRQQKHKLDLYPLDKGIGHVASHDWSAVLKTVQLYREQKRKA